MLSQLSYRNITWCFFFFFCLLSLYVTGKGKGLNFASDPWRWGWHTPGICYPGGTGQFFAQRRVLAVAFRASPSIWRGDVIRGLVQAPSKPPQRLALNRFIQFLPLLWGWEVNSILCDHGLASCILTCTLALGLPFRSEFWCLPFYDLM